jgi:endonuclease III
MPRGIMPRQPAKTRQQNKVASSPLRAKLVATTPIKPASKLPTTRTTKPPKTYNPTAPDRISQILAALDEMYPGVTCALTHSSAWELLVATILSAQCTDVRVNMVTPIIFKKYPTPQHFAALHPEELEPDIQSTGFFRNKSKSVVGAARKIIEEFNGQVPNEMDKLLTIPGVARKTANVVLGTWFRKADGVVVDTHVTRISRRLELTKENDAPKIEQDLMRVIPREKWIDFSHQIIHHGRALCIARKPKCADCKLETICHAADKTWSTVEIHKTAQP